MQAKVCSSTLTCSGDKILIYSGCLKGGRQTGHSSLHPTEREGGSSLGQRSELDFSPCCCLLGWKAGFQGSTKEAARWGGTVSVQGLAKAAGWGLPYSPPEGV